MLFSHLLPIPVEIVEVRILYDAFGSHGTKAKDFNRLIKNGGHVHTFVTSQKALLRFRLNYHDHLGRLKVILFNPDIQSRIMSDIKLLLY
ncbi:hypothetical protein EfmAA96_10730 [Enterococcus faecium]|nr:hypothetical protein EfmAA96_10730 [Enterococcus faecium]